MKTTFNKLTSVTTSNLRRCRSYPRWSGGSVLDTGPKIHGFKPGRGDGFLRAMKIRSTTFFEGEVKPSVPCRRFYGMLKNPMSVEEILRAQNSDNFFVRY
jgi:hypothetical protein